MDYLIYTYDGGGDLLISILNAIGMIFKSNNTYLTPVGQLGMSIGIVYAGAKALTKGDIPYFLKGFMTPSLIIIFAIFSPKATVWIKDDAALTAPVKIDNIPFGIAFFTSVATKFSHHTSKLLEETMLPPGAQGATTTGLLYGAKAAVKVRDVQIKDPILLRNTKEYLRQCYMIPYVMGNFGGKRSEAIQSTDLLGFLNTNPVKCFGIKPTNADGSIGKFMTCTEAGKMISLGVKAEANSPGLMTQFASSIVISTSNEVLMTRRIKAMTTDIFHQLNQGHEDINSWMQQAMILNANRESYDDKREQYDLSRSFPELVRMQATRGLFQQGMGSIIGAEMSEAMIPAAVQPTVLALVVMLFVIALPLMLLPGGWSTLMNGIKLIVWVSSWPVFYTVIHAISMMQMKDAIVDGWGEDGLSLVGQEGFTQLLMMKYATAQSLVSATPVISFAIVFGSPYALSGIASGIASVAQSVGLGSSMADGNLSMKQSSYDNTTRGQHNHTPTLQMGSGVINDGAMSVQTSQDGQSNVITEYGHNLLNNHVQSENWGESANQSLSDAQSIHASTAERKAETTTLTDTQSTDFATKIANGTVTSAGVSTNSQATLKEAFSLNESTVDSTSTGETHTTGTHANAGVDILGGISALTGVKAGVGASAANTKEIRQGMTEDKRQAFDTAMEEVKTAAKTGNFATNNSEDRTLGTSLGTNLTKLEQISKEEAIQKQDVATYSNQVSYAANNSGTINRNLNEPFIQEVMSRHPELTSADAALRWSKTHQAEAASIGKDVVAANDPFKTEHYKSYVENMNKNTPSAQNMTIPAADSLNEKYQNKVANVNKQAVITDATGGNEPIKKVVNNTLNDSDLRYNGTNKNILKKTLNPDQVVALNKLENEKNKGDGSVSQEMVDKMQKAKTDFKSPTGKSASLRLGAKIASESESAIKASVDPNNGIGGLVINQFLNNGDKNKND